MKKVILFDSWTKGSIHIFRLLDGLKKNDIEISLVHAGSWGDERGRPVREVINGLNVADVKAYGSLENIINIEMPDAVIFLSLDPLLHRAFNRYCIKYKIPTVNLYHGVHSVFKTLTLDKSKIAQYWFSLFRSVFDRLWYVFFVYAKSLVDTGAKVDEWFSLFSDVYKKIFGIAVVKSNLDANTSYICVFNEFDQLQAYSKYTVPLENIRVVGYPDILKFNGLESGISKYICEESYKHRSIVYIGTGARGTRMLLSNDVDYFSFISNTYNSLRELGVDVIFKLHYSRLRSVKEMFKNSKLSPEFCDDDKFIETLANSAGAIVEPSTAALVPMLMGKPIFLTRYDMLEGIEFGDIIKQYPKAYSIYNTEDFHEILTPLGFDVEETRRWIGKVSGPLPASLMPARVVETLLLATER